MYDIAKSQWTKQATDGPTPKYRVNPCAAVASAADGSSHNIYFFGGQDLIPYGEQKQYDDSWILTLPSFTWIKLDTDGQSVPPARAGHSCEMYGESMVVIGGYVGQELSCDSPGIYVFNASGAQWTTGFVAPPKGGLSGQPQSPRAYKVPQAVIDVVGGSPNGGATVTRPARAPDSDSPVATGQPGDYRYTTLAPYQSLTVSTRTNSDGSLTTITSTPSPSGPPNSNGGRTPWRIGVIAGSVVLSIMVLVGLVLLGLYIRYRRRRRDLREKGLAQIERPSRRTSGAGQSEGLIGNQSATDLRGVEPTFWGMLLSPRRSLRVVNR